MFDLENLRDYCLRKKGVTEEFPFGEDTLVYKVMGKMFLLTGLDNADFRFNIKCAPEQIENIRAKYPAVQPGYHMNKNHWNTVAVNGTIPVKELKQMIDESYELVVKTLTKKMKAELNEL